MIILDTNVISEIQKNNPDKLVLSWLDQLDHNEVRLCSIVLAELCAGAEKFRLTTGSIKYVEMLEVFRTNLPNHEILPFDEKAANRFGRLKASAYASGLAKPNNDLMIASICLVNNAKLATRNEKNFDGLGINVINPFNAI